MIAAQTAGGLRKPLQGTLLCRLMCIRGPESLEGFMASSGSGSFEVFMTVEQLRAIQPLRQSRPTGSPRRGLSYCVPQAW